VAVFKPNPARRGVWAGLCSQETSVKDALQNLLKNFGLYRVTSVVEK
jgi:hypothetical protein